MSSVVGSRLDFSREERVRFLRMAHRDQRRVYMLAHHALRHILASYLSIPPAQVAFRTQTGGKPELVGTAPARGLHFNISHSGDRAAIAVSRAAALGVDIERVRYDGRVEAVIRRFFASEERDILEGYDAQSRHKAAFQLWSLKEAYIKATGKGLAQRLDSFAMDWRRDRPVLIRSIEASEKEWTLRSFSPHPDYCGAVAVRSRRVSVRHLSLRYQSPGRYLVVP
ncbi:4'-phosphopantetheinyl transferase family protein [Pseudovibrio ascidiaceicola]|uniref:4'-phosphopantetheinyl transferase family protein n=2 Tax=Pseudovibrio TaxID=258255 RepID=UPI003D367837